MNRSSQRPLGCFLILAGGLLASLTTLGDAVSSVQSLREGGCGGIQPPAKPLNRNAQLDLAAQRWAAGQSTAAAVAGSGYRADTTAALHLSGTEPSLVDLLRRSSCRTLAQRDLQDIGAYRRGQESWVLLGASSPAAGPQTPALATRVLQLVNDVRARGARCGERSFGSAPPVKLSGTLSNVALGHAADMADHNYFEHADLTGNSPADRVRAAGYREKLVGENIAYGPESAEEVVQGWLESPGHCENIMDTRFAEMGVAYAAGHARKHGLYWVQLLASPRA